MSAGIYAALGMSVMLLWRPTMILKIHIDPVHQCVHGSVQVASGIQEQVQPHVTGNG